MTDDIRLTCRFCNAWAGGASEVAPVTLASAKVYLCPNCSSPLLTITPPGLSAADLVPHLETADREVLRAVLDCLTTSMMVDHQEAR